MEFLLIRISDAGVKTGEPNEGSLARERTQKSASHLIIDPNAIDVRCTTLLCLKLRLEFFDREADYHFQTLGSYKGERWEDGNGARVGN
jgi:hypothetical protein